MPNILFFENHISYIFQKKIFYQSNNLMLTGLPNQDIKTVRQHVTGS